MGGLFVCLGEGHAAFGGVDRLNQALADVLRRRFEIAARPEQATLQVGPFSADMPAPPRRLFVDHGSFADASFWACTAPRLRQDDTILVSSRVCLAVAERQLAPPAPRLHLVPYFADTETFRPTADRAGARRRLAADGLLPADGPLLLCVSAYSRRKNLHLALRLLHALGPSVPGARLALVGRPTPSQMDYALILRRLVIELGLDQRVHFLPTMPHDRLAAVMAASDLLVHLTTCRLENFGLVVAEAQAAGLPVLAADWGGLRDLVVPGATGLLAPTYLTSKGPRVDWLGAAEMARALLADSERRDEMAHAAWRWAQESLSPAAFATRLRSAVEQVLEAGSADGSPVRLSSRGEDLLFAALQINRGHPELRSTSEEYRLLLGLDDGELARFLTGPAATWEHPPRVGPQDRVYPVVAVEPQAQDRLEVTDPAWPAEFAMTPAGRAVLSIADGETALGPLAGDAQRLVDQGVVCPVGRGLGR